MIPKEEREAELFELEKKKVKALEKIANSLDALAIWVEEIDKQDWSDRVQFYLAEWHNQAFAGKSGFKNDAEKENPSDNTVKP